MGLFDKFKKAAGLGESKPDDQMLLVDKGDKVMNNAIEQAKATLPDYLNFLENAPVNTHNHRVKAHFVDSYGSEHIWLVDISALDGAVHGIVGNHPDIVDCVEGGQQVAVPVESLTDWAFEADGVQYGNYTVYAMFEKMSPAEVQQYVQAYGFTQNPLKTPNATFAQLIAGLPEPTEEDYAVAAEEEALSDEMEGTDGEKFFGLTLQDYGAAGGKLAAGVSPEDVLQALGISAEDYIKASESWNAQMAADDTFQLTTRYSEYFVNADAHPQLGHLQA